MKKNEMRREETRRVEGERRPDQMQSPKRAKFWELVDKKLLLQLVVFARCGNFGANQHKLVNIYSFWLQLQAPQR